MIGTRCPSRFVLRLIVCVISAAICASKDEDDYHVQYNDGSYEFGHANNNNFHHAKANSRNIVRGEFGGRNPKTGGVDVVEYTAGPRGFRPRGSNIARKYDLSQVRRGPIGSRDDPYFDPNEDPSYEFAFKTRTYQKSESSNRVGDIKGQYSYLDDVGERHNVEYIAGKNTGFHVKTPYPDSNPRAYGPLFYNGRGRPIPRGRTSIQRGLDGSYRFVSAGPDQRRTEQSDAHGNTRGSYTYLDDKGVQHSVHYIAGPQIGYRVLKNVKGPHLPSVFPFSGPNIVSGDFYSYLDKHSHGDGNFGSGSNDGDDGTFDRPRPKPSGALPRPKPSSEGSTYNKPSYDYDLGDFGGYGDGSNVGEDLFGGGSSSVRPTPGSNIVTSGSSGTSGSGTSSLDVDDKDYQESDLFGGRPSGRPSQQPSTRPTPSTSRPTSSRPSYGESSEAAPSILDDGLFGPVGTVGSTSGTPNTATTPVLTISAGQNGHKTIVTNVGDRTFTVPPGLSVRAHVQSIDLYPYESKVPSPSDQFRAETTLPGQRLTTRQIAKDDLLALRSTAPPTTTTHAPNTTRRESGHDQDGASPQEEDKEEDEEVSTETLNSINSSESPSNVTTSTNATKSADS